METVKWGIIGCGDVCEKKSGPAFYKTPHSELIAVMRRDEAKARDFAMRHHVSRFYSDAGQPINDPEVNAVYIATPPDSHKAYAIRAMQAGKPVYVEKPMALNAGECEEMIRVSEQTGQKLFTAFYRRGQEYFRKVKELIDTGAIGTTVSIDLRMFRPPSPADKNPAEHSWRIKKEIAGGGYFYDLAPHTLDIIDFINGPVAEVAGFVTNRGGWYDVEDMVSIAFRLESGVTGTGVWCFVADESHQEDIIQITGTKGRILCNTFAYRPIHLMRPDGNIEYPVPPPEHVQQPLIQSIVEELRGNGSAPSNGYTALRTAKVMDAIFNRQE